MWQVRYADGFTSQLGPSRSRSRSRTPPNILLGQTLLLLILVSSLPQFPTSIRKLSDTIQPPLSPWHRPLHQALFGVEMAGSKPANRAASAKSPVTTPSLYAAGARRGTLQKAVHTSLQAPQFLGPSSRFTAMSPCRRAHKAPPSEAGIRRFVGPQTLRSRLQALHQVIWGKPASLLSTRRRKTV
jgi:hypothetical protein